ncbi:unnamed protein product, partial [Owenia fusiformis]
CNTQECRTCLWSDWGQWVSGTCSVTCGSGSETQTRTRSKSWGSSSAGSSDCLGRATGRRIVSCTRDQCRGCRWTDWGMWVDGPCPVSCGGGSSTSTRRRTKLEKVIGGARICPGSDFEMRTSPCNTNQCCEWSSWSNWLPRNGGIGGSCPVTCGGGIINAYRTRTKILGTGGLPDCPGVSEEQKTERCNTQDCPTCLWSNWGRWVPGLCSVSCGSGFESQIRSRNKTWGTDPEGSLDCFGSTADSKSVPCTRVPCRGCRWTDWTQWINGICSVICGGGVSTSTRRRTKLENVIGGSPICPGSDFEMRTLSCNTNQCCKWSSWSPWIPRNGEFSRTCPVTCGGGSINFYRTRTKTFNTSGSSPVCPGVSEEQKTKRCNTQGCPSCGIWQPWEPWTCQQVSGVYVIGCTIPGRLVRTRMCPICPVGRSVDDERVQRRKRHGSYPCDGVSIEKGSTCCL